jgi:adenylate cyclase
MPLSWPPKFGPRWPWPPLPGPVGESVVRLARPLLAASLLVTGATLGLRSLGWLEFVELTAYDHFMQRQPDLGPDNRLLVVGITETDLQTLQEWPVSDRSLARAIAQLQQHDPAVIAVDITRDFPQEPGHREFMAQLSQHPNILLPCKTSSLDDLGTPPPPGLSPDQVGFADLVIDPGGILRRSLLLVTPPQPAKPFPKQHVCNDPTQTLLSLGFRSTLLYLQAQGIEAGFTEAGELYFGPTIIPKIGPNTGGYRNADTAGYQVMLHYRSAANAVEQISLLDLLDGQVDPALVRDRIVMLGYTTPQAKDDFYTPFSSARSDKQKMPGVVVHAQSASQLLATVLDGQPLLWVWPHPAELLWIVGWSLLGGILGWYSRHPAAFALVIVLGAGGLYAVSLAIFFQGGWIPVVPPALTFLGTAVGVVLLDRFNNSAYGQQVYRTVKTLLHLDIEIDEDKLEKQVAEITESDYFRDLQDKVKTLREGGPSLDSPFDSAVPGWPGDDALAPGAAAHLDSDLEALNLLLAPDPLVPPQRDPLATQDHAPTDDGLEFLNDLNREAQQFKQQRTEAIAVAQDPPPADDDGRGFLDDLTQEAQGLKPPSSPYSPFTLEDAFCRCGDTSDATARYVNFIDHEIKQLKQSLRDRVGQGDSKPLDGI